MQEENVITVEGLRKRYGPITAIDGISFQVQKGEIFGMVGPNGSGKTTTIECVEGLRQPDEGVLRVLDLDPQQDARHLRERTGVQLQSSNLPNRMKVEEALDLFASFYQITIDWRSLLEGLGLSEKRRANFNQLSGGQKQRLFLALALINQPVLVFLDELTTGLDPQARRVTWELVREIRSQGKTIFLTTHFMDEAEQLCDRVAVLDHGRIIALDTPKNLVNQLDIAIRISFNVNGSIQPEPGVARNRSPEVTFIPALMGVIDGVQRVEQEGDQVTIYGQGEGLVGEVIKSLQADNIPFHKLHIEQANLEDVFLALTGRAIRN